MAQWQLTPPPARPKGGVRQEDYDGGVWGPSSHQGRRFCQALFHESLIQETGLGGLQIKCSHKEILVLMEGLTLTFHFHKYKLSSGRKENVKSINFSVHYFTAKNRSNFSYLTYSLIAAH